MPGKTVLPINADRSGTTTSANPESCERSTSPTGTSGKNEVRDRWGEIVLVGKALIHVQMDVSNRLRAFRLLPSACAERHCQS
jgi:hypothetical protein